MTIFKSYLFSSSVFLTLVAPFFSHAQVDVQTQDIGSQDIKAPVKAAPFSFSGSFDAATSARIKNGFFKKDRIQFNQAEITLDRVVYYDSCHTEGLQIGLGFDTTYLRWENNPYINQDHYNALEVNLSGFTGRIKNWFWRTQLTANIDTNQWSSEYTSYDILGWGRYAYSSYVGLHIGFLAMTGLDMNYVYPIVGFDYQITERLKLTFVFPVDMKLDYKLTKSWVISAAARVFDIRYRVEPGDSFHKALVRYTSTGAELALRYVTKNLQANVHAGYTLWTRYRIANQHNHNGHKYRLETVPYFGAEATAKF